MKAIPLFNTSLGLNDIRGGTAASVNYDTGKCELQECIGASVTDDGNLILSRGPVSIDVNFDSAVTAVSYGSRLVVHAGTGLYVVNDLESKTPVVVKIATVAASTIPVVHTNIDFRYCDGSSVFIVTNGSDVAVAASVGVYPGPATSTVYSAMPAFDGGFVYGGILYVWKDEFVLHSMPWAYDCWSAADNFVWLGKTVLDGVAGSGAIAFATAADVTVLVGSSMADFVYREATVAYVAKSLAKADVITQERCFYFLAANGVYEVSASTGWDPKRTTAGRVEESFWLTATDAVVEGNVYRVQGTPYSLEYHIPTQGVYKVPTSMASPLCVVGTTLFTSYGNTLAILSNVPSELVITFAKFDFALPNLKRLQAITLSGTIVGELTVSVQTEVGAILSTVETFTGVVDSYKFKEFRTLKGNSFTVTLVFNGEYFLLRGLSGYATLLAGV
jgi:hypothetical protein